MAGKVKQKMWGTVFRTKVFKDVMLADVPETTKGCVRTPTIFAPCLLKEQLFHCYLA
jgi:hypothetical protein